MLPLPRTFPSSSPAQSSQGVNNSSTSAIFHGLLLVYACALPRTSEAASGGDSAPLASSSPSPGGVGGAGGGTQYTSTLKVYSLTHERVVHQVRLAGRVTSMEAAPNVLAVAVQTSGSENPVTQQVHVYDSTTFELRFRVPTFPMSIDDVSLALGPRWLAVPSSALRHKAVPAAAHPETSAVSADPLATLASSDPGPSALSHLLTSSVSSSAKMLATSGRELAAGLYTKGGQATRAVSAYISGETSSPRGQGAAAASDAVANEPGHLAIYSLSGEHIDGCQLLAHFRAHEEPISALEFDASGTLLASVSRTGQHVHVYQLLVSASDSARSRAPYEVRCLYRLSRGITHARVRHLSFSTDSHFLAVCTSGATAHVYAINPMGGRPSRDSHVVSLPLKRPQHGVSSVALHGGFDSRQTLLLDPIQRVREADLVLQADDAGADGDASDSVLDVPVLAAFLPKYAPVHLAPMPAPVTSVSASARSAPISIRGVDTSSSAPSSSTSSTPSHTPPRSVLSALLGMNTAPPANPTAVRSLGDQLFVLNSKQQLVSCHALSRAEVSLRPAAAEEQEAAESEPVAPTGASGGETVGLTTRLSSMISSAGQSLGEMASAASSTVRGTMLPNEASAAVRYETLYFEVQPMQQWDLTGAADTLAAARKNRKQHQQERRQRRAAAAAAQQQQQQLQQQQQPQEATLDFPPPLSLDGEMTLSMHDVPLDDPAAQSAGAYVGMQARSHAEYMHWLSNSEIEPFPSNTADVPLWASPQFLLCDYSQQDVSDDDLPRVGNAAHFTASGAGLTPELVDVLSKSVSGRPIQEHKFPYHREMTVLLPSERASKAYDSRARVGKAIRMAKRTPLPLPDPLDGVTELSNSGSSGVPSLISAMAIREDYFQERLDEEAAEAGVFDD